MNSFELNIIDEKSRAGSEFMFRIAQEIQRAFLIEKKSRKITQQSIADTLGTSRAVINRQLQGLENIGARRIGELLWAMGWEPHFEARKIPAGENLHPPTELAMPSVKVLKMSPPSTSGGTVVLRSLNTAA
jgi:hypothetical protein